MGCCVVHRRRPSWARRRTRSSMMRSSRCGASGALRSLRPPRPCLPRPAPPASPAAPHPPQVGDHCSAKPGYSISSLAHHNFRSCLPALSSFTSASAALLTSYNLSDFLGVNAGPPPPGAQMAQPFMRAQESRGASSRYVNTMTSSTNRQDRT